MASAIWWGDPGGRKPNSEFFASFPLAVHRVFGTGTYEVFNPVMNPTFVFFIYDAPDFITSDRVVPGSALAFNNSVHPVTSIDFIMSASDPLDTTDPTVADVRISIAPSPGVPTVQDKFLPPADLSQYGIYQFANGSFGAPNSFLSVEAPEPASITLLGAGALGLLGLRRRRGGH